MSDNPPCSECIETEFERRGVLPVAGAVTANSTGGWLVPTAPCKATKLASDNLIQKPYESLGEEPKSGIACSWRCSTDRGFLRTRHSNKRRIASPQIATTG